MRKLVTGAAFGALFLAVKLAWNLIAMEPAAEPTASELAAEAARFEAEIAEEIASGKAEPALEWLAGPDNMLFEGDPGTVQSLIESLYEAGAVDVWFTGIEEFGGKNISAAIAVELPQDAGTRARLLQAQASFWEETEAEPDVGQRYLHFAFD
jgi:hypothetical protein